MPASITSLKGVKTIGGEAVTVPANTSFYDDTVRSTTCFSASDVGINAGTTAVSATFYMPPEADDYSSVPRLSPADGVDWMPYAFNVGDTAKFGKPTALTAIPKDTIIIAFATTVTAGVAIIGATALSF